jgi:hypothetical protein
MVWVSFNFERGDQFILVSGELGGGGSLKMKMKGWRGGGSIGR